MTKILFIFIFYFISMYSLLIFIDILVGIPFNISLRNVLTPFEVTDPGEFIILITFTLITIANPLIYYFKLLKQKLSANN